MKKSLRSRARQVVRELLDDADPRVRLEAVRIALALPVQKLRRPIEPAARLDGFVSLRLRRALDRLGIDPTVATVGTLAAHGERFLRGMKFVGDATVNEARAICRRAGLELGP